MTNARNIVTETLHWQGLTIEVSYEPNHSQALPDLAHLQIETIEPPRAPVPMSETGYRSHFLSREHVEKYGGPLGYVSAWLNEAAQDTKWKQAEASRRQAAFQFRDMGSNEAWA